MEKQALLNTVFGAMTAKDSIDSGVKAYQGTENQYDNLLGVNMTKTPTTMGQRNAVTSNDLYSTASDSIDELYNLSKEASIKSRLKAGVIDAAILAKLTKENAINGWKHVQKLDEKNTKHIKDAVNSFKNGNIKSGMKSSGKAALFTVPATGAIVAGGVGAGKAIDKLDNKKGENKNDALPKMVSGALTAAAIANVVANKRFTPSASSAGTILKTTLTKQPKEIIKKTGPAGKFVVDTYEKTIKNVAKHQDDTSKAIRNAKGNLDKASSRARTLERMKADKLDYEQKLRKAFEDEGMTYNHVKRTLGVEHANKIFGKPKKTPPFIDLEKKKLNKTSNEQIDELAKQAGYKSFAKHLGNIFVTKGLESIPYVGVPALAAYIMKRDMKKGMRRLDTPENIEKQADFISSVKKYPKLEKGIKRGAEKGVEGLGRVLFPATASAIIGRNLAGNFEDIRNPDYDNQQSGMAKIIINVADNANPRKVKRQVSKAIDDAYKQASEDSTIDIGDILNSVNENADKDIKGTTEKLKGRKVHIGQGIKKLFKKEEMKP